MRPAILGAIAGGGSGASIIYNASKIAAAIADLKTANVNRRSIVWCGHSVIQGVGSDGTGGTGPANASSWRASSMPSKLALAMNTALGGSASYGIETFAIAQRDRFTLSGGATLGAQYGLTGPGGFQVVFSAAAHSCSFAVNGSSIRVYAYATAAGTQARYTVNGGSVQTVAGAAGASVGFGTRVWYEFVISGLTAGDTVALLGPTSSAYAVFGVDVNYITTPGITMHRMAYSGFMMAQTLGPCLDGTDTDPAGGWTSGADEATFRSVNGVSQCVRPAPSLVLTSFDINDLKAYGGSGTAWGWSLATHKRHMTNFAQFLAAQSLPLLIVTGPTRDPALTIADGTPYDQDDLIAVYREVSDEQPNVAFYDLTQVFAPGQSLANRYTAQQASGYIFDSVHPNAAGAVYFANLVAAGLLQ